MTSGTNLLNSNATRLPVVSIQDGTLRFANAGAVFQNELRGSTLNDYLGNFVVNVNADGKLDLNGLSFKLGGLTGNGTVLNDVAGIATLTVNNGFGVDTTFLGSIEDGTGTVGLSAGLCKCW